MSGFFFKAVVQAVLLFGSETWAVTPRMEKSMGGVQYQVERQLMGRLPRKKPDGKGTYTSVAPEHGHTVYCYVITVRPV